MRMPGVKPGILSLPVRFLDALDVVPRRRQLVNQGATGEGVDGSEVGPA